LLGAFGLKPFFESDPEGLLWRVELKSDRSLKERVVMVVVVVVVVGCGDGVKRKMFWRGFADWTSPFTRLRENGRSIFVDADGLGLDDDDVVGREYVVLC
jgi:hypothetical protein